ncbi:RNA methyltransferase [Streptococcus chenjunshii]|uniref:RNA methyltransferase n=1 Tax=Streptococcus chenjunshii TaxID=2173853 RepID=A0A372KNZ2_9STRE|nr:RsmB/NOP family class I SAM-dependent RNA methyltransferase [Streptococcus chenjunshii]AXQ78735.1 RNA methyltransferase [Streptococcus chenjunshii]RFU51672.1 RNA methyltransferase [Streptococcus chenjunshii]RFU53993.1 RNA methyltransferase [Streptococcus chenjunshii]
MKILPDAFIQKYQELLGQEAAAFFASLKEEPVPAFRTNPLKKSQQSFSCTIPNTDWGHYGKISGKSAEHVTGLVYSQEPAAQMVGQAAAPKKGMRVLDLAAAPGGKSTHILSYLDNTGILVSNEISSKRCKSLVENIERFGAQNVVVTNESAQNLAKTFRHYFDLIVFDAPCSGEGMFRKEPEAVRNWQDSLPAKCADLQKQILREAIPMLAYGGQLVYSTCTWSPEENEEVVSWLLQEYDYLDIVELPKLNGMTEGIGLPEAARMYPHRFKGEGQFIAKIKDNRDEKAVSLPRGKSNLTREEAQLWQEFAAKHLKRPLKGLLQTFGANLYLLPDGLPDLSGLKIARNGLHLGTFKKKRFEPSFALGLALPKHDIEQSIEIDIEQFKRYVSGDIIFLTDTYPNGWYQLCVKGNGLGFAKVVGHTIKNYFPKGLRFYA